MQNNQFSAFDSPNDLVHVSIYFYFVYVLTTKLKVICIY